MTGSEATSLFHLRCIWGDAYSVAFRDGVWSAYRVNGAEVLTDDTAEGLAMQIQADYSAWLAALRAAVTP